MAARLYLLDTNVVVFMIRALNPRRPDRPDRAKAERIVSGPEGAFGVTVGRPAAQDVT